MDMDIFTTTPVSDEVIAKLGEGLIYTRVGRSEPGPWHGPDYLPSSGPGVDRVYFLDLSGEDEDGWWGVRDEVISRALALIPGELAFVNEWGNSMVDRTAAGEVRYRHKDPYCRPFLVKSLGPV
jgi:hypothetical protein